MDCELRCWGDAPCSQPGTNAEHIPTVGTLHRAPELNTQDTVLTMRDTFFKSMATHVILEASLGNLAAPETSVPLSGE
jgi:hypothetical protein